MGLTAEYEIRNPENVVMDGPVMFAANHISNNDAIIMQSVIQRPLCFMSKAELFQNPITAWFFNQIGAFPVKRGEFDRQSILNARKVLNSGLALMMFPEGTRTHGKGMIEAHSGAAYMAMRNHCRIVPVAIAGDQDVLKKGLRRVKVQVTFCSPIQADEKETANQFTERLMRTIAGQLPESLRGFYA